MMETNNPRIMNPIPARINTADFAISATTSGSESGTSGSSPEFSPDPVDLASIDWFILVIGRLRLKCEPKGGGVFAKLHFGLNNTSDPNKITIDQLQE